MSPAASTYNEYGEIKIGEIEYGGVNGGRTIGFPNTFRAFDVQIATDDASDNPRPA
jgi:hypothetical protein